MKPTKHEGKRKKEKTSKKKKKKKKKKEEEKTGRAQHVGRSRSSSSRVNGNNRLYRPDYSTQTTAETE